jgi:histone H3/H4
MTAAGAEIVSRDAVELLLNHIEDRAKKLTTAALVFAKHSKRKKISKDDMGLAVEQKGSNQPEIVGRPAKSSREAAPTPTKGGSQSS